MKSKILLLFILALQLNPVLAERISDHITVTVRGKGPDVVLIPGLACSAAVWNGTAAHLEGNYRLHIVQIAGFGGEPTGGNARGTIIQPAVDAIDAYIKSNHLKSPMVIGHSLGGLMGMMLASQHPEDVKKLMVVEALPFFGVLMGAKDPEVIAPQAAFMRDRILGQTQEAYAQSEKEFLRTMVKSAEGYKQATNWAITSDKLVVARALYEDMTMDLRPKLSAIKQLTTILYAWDTSVGMPQAAADKLYQEVYAALPNKTFVRVDSSLHFVMLDQPALFASKVDLFLK